MVLDRPNPINGVAVEGPMLNPAYRSFVGLHAIPVRHGKTIGELAEQFRRDTFGNCDLRVLPMQGWEREMWFDDTGLPWVMPSPNMPTLATAWVFVGSVLIEATELSEGRGTTRPFELIGAPGLPGAELARKMNERRLPGVVYLPGCLQPLRREVLDGLQHGEAHI